MENNFEHLGISKELAKVLKKNGISKPTPIQQISIPTILAGKDISGKAQTGTGKTLAFMLPLFEKIDINKGYTQGLIITPTRELAIQLTEEAKKLTPYKDVNILAIYGGQDVSKQRKKLKRGVELIIATPGRLLDHL
ncbi:MAG TPA: DEAD/DEAH box helicase, partial [Epulopiscium sp.]|nr:DEAD/DEAH box helicase [Candidatus Epulonipiscium sp.]